MRDAAVPGDHQKSVVGKNVTEHVGVREDRSEHQRPRNDASAVHRMRGQHVLAAEDGLANQRPSDAMGDRVHC